MQPIDICIQASDAFGAVIIDDPLIICLYGSCDDVRMFAMCSTVSSSVLLLLLPPPPPPPLLPPPCRHLLLSLLLMPQVVMSYLC